MTARSPEPRRLLVGAVTVVLGGAIAVQSRVNGELSHHTGSGLFPAWWTMLTGFTLLTVIVVATASVRHGLADVARSVRSGALPVWVLTGGLFGSFFLVIQSLTVPVAGVAVFTVGVVAGQTTGSLLVDRLGLTGTGRRAVTVRRVVAAALAVAAVAVGVSDRLASAGRRTVPLELSSRCSRSSPVRSLLRSRRSTGGSGSPAAARSSARGETSPAARSRCAPSSGSRSCSVWT